MDDTLAQMAGATVFSKLDANCGFWQIPLSESCQKLTIIITPFSRYYFKRLPFGICSAQEHFQRRMGAILAGNDGVLCHMDLPTPLPEYPWQRVASDSFKLNKKTLTSTMSASVIRVLKSIFVGHGIPETLVSDNGPQHASQEIEDFAREYNFVHVTSSPYYQQSNGLAERMVKNIKVSHWEII